MPGHEALKFVMKSMDSLQSDLKKMNHRMDHPSEERVEVDVAPYDRESFHDGIAKATSILKGIDMKPEGSEIDEFEDRRGQLPKEPITLPDKLRPSHPDAVFLQELIKETKTMIRKLKLV